MIRTEGYFTKKVSLRFFKKWQQKVMKLFYSPISHLRPLSFVSNLKAFVKVSLPAFYF